MAKLKFKGKNKKTRRQIEEEVDEEDLNEEEEEDEDDEEEEEPTKKRKSTKRKSSEKKKTSKKKTSKSSSKRKSSKKSSKKTSSKKSKKKSFLKTGKARKAAIKKDKAIAKQREAEYGSLWRFYIGKKRFDDDHILTFVDGYIDDNEELENPVYFEHNVRVSGRWTQFVSCQDDEPDPLQEADKEPYLAQVFTIIDRSEYEDDDGELYPPKKKLLVVKRKQQKMLQKLASINDGLAGCTFNVTRTGKDSSNVGDVWTLIDKMEAEDIADELLDEGVEEKDLKEMLEAADYEEELTYYTADELEKLGIVQSQSTISQKSANEDADDIDEDL